MNYRKQVMLIENYIPKEITEALSSFEYFIAGGTCTSVFSGNKINDIDLFFNTSEDCQLAISAFSTVAEMKLSFNTDNATSYNYKGKKFQIIKCMFGTPEEIIAKFDYTVVMCAYIPKTKTFVMSDKFLYHLAEKCLVFNPTIEYPITSLIRSKKYLLRGYHFPTVEMLKIALAINNLKMETYKDLREQLEGIDTLALKDLTDSLLANEDKKVDFTELMTFVEDYLNKYLDKNEEQ